MKSLTLWRGTLGQHSWFGVSEMPSTHRPVWGGRLQIDLEAALDCSWQVASLFSNAKLLVIPQAGHMAICEKPVEAVHMSP